MLREYTSITSRAALAIFATIGCLFVGLSCRRDETQFAAWKDLRGWVIASESCFIDSTKNYWLIDFSDQPFDPPVGDTIQLNGVQYNHILKAKGLVRDLQKIGQRVDITYNIISQSRSRTPGCDLANADTIPLKEIFIIAQGVVR